MKEGTITLTVPGRRNPCREQVLEAVQVVADQAVLAVVRAIPAVATVPAAIPATPLSARALGSETLMEAPVEAAPPFIRTVQGSKRLSPPPIRIVCEPSPLLQ